jgi:hypothetical protein
MNYYEKNKEIELNPEIWGPHYWYFLHTISIIYPKYPNSIIKKQYYNFIMNLPLFIPNKEIAKYFEELLDQYPVSSYLDDNESLIRWFWFIHNKINIKLNKSTITLEEFYIKNYEKNTMTKKDKYLIYYNVFMKFIYILLIFLLIYFIYINIK